MKTFDRVNVHEIVLRVQMADVDAGGVIYHARYLNMYNQARDTHLRDMGIPYRDLAAGGTNFSIAESRCRYLKPVFYDEVVVIRTWIPWYRTRSFGVSQEMLRDGSGPGGPRVCNQAEFAVVVTRSVGESAPIPESLILAMETWNLEGTLILSTGGPS
jgi:YbgC/YbaW family acyl-CoA thioester hydrolase